MGITFCLVLHVAVAKLNIARIMAKFDGEEAPARLDRSEDLQDADPLVRIRTKTKGDVTDINECVEMCNDMSCEYWSFYEANWLKRRRCILYTMTAMRWQSGRKWSSGETNCED